MQANIFRHKRKLARTAFCFTLLLSLSAALLPRAYAQSHTDRKFSPETGAIVNTTIELMNADDFKSSLARMDELLQNHDLNSYEKSIVFQMKGQAHYELKQTGEAIQAFEDAITAGGLLANEVSQLRLNIGQLLITEGGDDAIRGYAMMEEWYPKDYYFSPQRIQMIIQGDCFSSCNYENVLPLAERWFNAANPKERKHYDLLNFLYNNLGRVDKQIEIVRQMIDRWPEDKSLRDALASMETGG